MIVVRLPPPLEKRLGDLAETTSRTKSYYVRQALEEYFANVEKRLGDLAETTSKTKSLYKSSLHKD